MKIGLKIGPKNWHSVLDQITPECVEVWFRLDWQQKYGDMFARLNLQSIPFGLHFWGILPDNLEPNLCSINPEIVEKSYQQMRQTLEIASEIGAHYVNIHPGTLKMKKLDLDQSQMTLIDGPVQELQPAISGLINRLKSLHQIAGQLGVLFITETLPKFEQMHWRNPDGRQQTQDPVSIDLQTMIKLSGVNLNICNDICHDLTWFAQLPENEAFNQLLNFSRQIKNSTKLVHVGTIAPPFNGTDSHNGILVSDYELGSFPALNDIRSLLQLYLDQSDIWIIPEPQLEHMVANYLVLKKLINN
jgi:hypothetical protein